MHKDVQALQKRIAGLPYSYQAISEESGIERTWISKFARGSIPNPGYAHFDALDKAVTRLARRLK